MRAAYSRDLNPAAPCTIATLTAEATAPVLESNEEREIIVETAIRDAEGDVVATAQARWMVGPRK